jgi:drug/metabolite transporter (DMT)-like permease
VFIRLLKEPRGAVLAIMMAALLWGSAFPAIKRGYVILGIVTGEVGPTLAFAGVRFLLAGTLLLAGATIFRLGPLPSRRHVPGLVALGLIQTTLQYSTFYLGMAYTTGVKASVIVASGSFFLAGLSPLFFRDDRLDRWRVGGLVVGFAGVLMANMARAGEVSLTGELIGDALILVTGLCSAVSSLLGKRLVRDLHPVTMNGVQITLGSTVLLAVSLPLIEVDTSRVSPELAGLTLYLALVTAVAFTLYYLVVKYHDLSRVAAYRFMIPVSGVVLSALLIPGESLGWNLVLAAVLVAVGVWAVNRRVHADPVRP